MTIEARDRRALAILAGALLLGGALFWLWPVSSESKVVGTSDSIPAAERRLKKVRQIASLLEGKQETLKKVSAELAAREQSLIRADTAPQAQAQLLDVAHRVAKSQTPPLEFGAVEMGQKVEPLGDDYGVVRITVPFNCQIEDLVNFLADLTKQPEAIATSDMHVSAGDPKKKTISVRLTIAGIVPRSLVPQRKKGPAF